MLLPSDDNDYNDDYNDDDDEWMNLIEEKPYGNEG